MHRTNSPSEQPEGSTDETADIFVVKFPVASRDKGENFGNAGSDEAKGLLWSWLLLHTGSGRI